MAEQEPGPSSALSVEVEEEFLLVDPGTGRTTAAAAEVCHIADALEAAGPDATVRARWSQTRVESATGRCAAFDELADRLAHSRGRLTTAVRAAGVWLVPSGCSILGGPVVPHRRFAALAATYAAAVSDHHACGCHVRVAVPDEETAVAVVNHLRPWLPTLLALSVNSPFSDGADTGYASWRTVQRSRLPASGMPPHAASARAYEARVSRLVAQGVLVDEALPLWAARPLPRLSAVELRVADTGIDVDAALLQAVLSHALVRTALAELDAGREAPAIGEQVGAAALWSAARHGLTGPGIHPVLERGAPATVLVSELLAAIRPALEENDVRQATEDAVRDLVRTGTGADRQRAAGTPHEAIHLLASPPLRDF
jgi:carboxylate-amine ligase